VEFPQRNEERIATADSFARQTRSCSQAKLYAEQERSSPGL